MGTVENRSKNSIRTQLMGLSLLVVVVSIVLSLMGALYLTLRQERESLDSNLLNSVTILARTQVVQNALTGTASTQELADFLDETKMCIRDRLKSVPDKYENQSS